MTTWIAEMFNRTASAVIVATDDQLALIQFDDQGQGQLALDLPLAPILEHGLVQTALPFPRPKNHQYLLIVPDHWFGHEFFPFQSQKASLIEPFLQRKLQAAHPQQPEVRHFFNYSCRAGARDTRGLNACFLSEDNGYRLYKALHQVGLAPRWITTPALIWQEQLKQIAPGYEQGGALLVQLIETGCWLYFYFEGHFLFSRNVALPSEGDRWGALLYEINQSLYLFSQKTKTELEAIYLIEADAEALERLSEMLAKPVRAVAMQAGSRKACCRLPARPVLDGLLHPKGLPPHSNLLSITHRQVQRHLEWKPVQWAGILIGLLLTLFLAGEQVWLERLLQREIKSRSHLVQNQSLALTDYADALDLVLEQTKRPSSADTVYKLSAALPENVWINELHMDMAPPALKFKATIKADNIERFRTLLGHLTANLNRQFNLSQPLQIQDVVFYIEDVGQGTGNTHYKVALSMDLS